MTKRSRWASLWALWRFVRSRESGASPKVLVLLALLYLVFPTDLVPDVLPLAGWLDDIGVLAFALTWVNRAFRRSKASSSPGAAGDAPAEGPTDGPADGPAEGPTERRSRRVHPGQSPARSI